MLYIETSNTVTLFDGSSHISDLITLNISSMEEEGILDVIWPVPIKTIKRLGRRISNKTGYPSDDQLNFSGFFCPTVLIHEWQVNISNANMPRVYRSKWNPSTNAPPSDTSFASRGQ